MPSIQDLIDAEFAMQQARDFQRFLASRGGVPTTNVAVEAGRATLVPIGVSEPAPVKPQAFCKYCGRVFKAKTAGMAKMQKNRHEKKDHAGQSATA